MTQRAGEHTGDDCQRMKTSRSLQCMLNALDSLTLTSPTSDFETIAFEIR